jgi:Na+-driven multidrug efflux pump
MAVMIFTLDLGMAGAAWATSISSLCSVLLIYYWYYAGKTSLRLRIIRRPEKSSVKEILSIATPRAMEEFSSGVFLLLQRVIIMMVRRIGGGDNDAGDGHPVQEVRHRQPGIRVVSASDRAYPGLMVRTGIVA